MNSLRGTDAPFRNEHFALALGTVLRSRPDSHRQPSPLWLPANGTCTSSAAFLRALAAPIVARRGHRRRVAKQRLRRRQIGARVEQVPREGSPGIVRRGVSEPYLAHTPLDDDPHGRRLETLRPDVPALEGPVEQGAGVGTPQAEPPLD